MSEYFSKEEDGALHQIFPGVTIRTQWLDRVMTSIVRFAPGSVVEDHSHPHEQMGMILEGTVDFTIGDETRRLGPGDLYRIPGGVVHRVVALDQPVRAFDVFAPVREDYR